MTTIILKVTPNPIQIKISTDNDFISVDASLVEFAKRRISEQLEKNETTYEAKEADKAAC